ncbi:Uncharacterised protein [Suttonella ornithocola]|uniref:Uncharacterized protein n=1 Tax=Suttonella ornithocola TaxID=279832 RepID=A0A380MR63_9GAMM|nr:Uncharacterised protein [Suttonella ornithocola]
MKFVLTLFIIGSCLFWIAQRRAQQRADKQRQALEKMAQVYAQKQFQAETDALNPHLNNKN